LFPKNIDNLTGTQFLIKITYLVIMKKSRTGQHCSIYTSQPASVIKGENPPLKPIEKRCMESIIAQRSFMEVFLKCVVLGPHRFVGPAPPTLG
jgi:hypothetical protein